MKKLLLFILLPFAGIAQIQIGSDINGLAGDTSGCSVSLSADGSIVAIGAYLNDNNGTDSGCVRIYQNVAGSWVQRGIDINGEGTGNQSGWSVSLSSDGNTLAVSAPKNNANGTNSGHVRIYKFQAGTWTQQGGDIDGQTAGDQSGFSVSLAADGNTIAIGSPGNTNNGNESGLVRVYQNTAGTWTQLGTDINSGSFYDSSGRSVALSADGNTIAIGAPYNSANGAYTGRIKVYKYETGVWTQQGADIKGINSNGIFGYSLSLSADGTTVASGAIGAVNNAGQVKVYKNIAGTWTQQGAAINGQANNDTSGRSVSLSADGNILAIGANFNTSNGAASGNVRIYKFATGAWSQLGIAIAGEAAGDNSGQSVFLSADGNTLAIGSPNNSNNGTGAGQARIYDLSLLLASDHFVLDHFSVYPNPASTVINISLGQMALEKVTLYNALGQLVIKAKTTTVDTSALPSGTYFVEIQTNKGKATKTIIIE